MNEKTAKLITRYAKHLNCYATARQVRSAKREWSDGHLSHREKGRVAAVMRNKLAKADGA